MGCLTNKVAHFFLLKNKTSIFKFQFELINASRNLKSHDRGLRYLFVNIMVFNHL